MNSLQEAPEDIYTEDFQGRLFTGRLLSFLLSLRGSIQLLSLSFELWLVTMRFSLLSSLAALAVGAYAQSSSVDAYVASESPAAKAGLLANIGPSGSKSSGAKVSIRGFAGTTASSHLRTSVPCVCHVER